MKYSILANGQVNFHFYLWLEANFGWESCCTLLSCSFLPKSRYYNFDAKTNSLANGYYDSAPEKIQDNWTWQIAIDDNNAKHLTLFEDEWLMHDFIICYPSTTALPDTFYILQAK